MVWWLGQEINWKRFQENHQVLQSCPSYCPYSGKLKFIIYVFFCIDTISLGAYPPTGGLGISFHWRFRCSVVDQVPFGRRRGHIPCHCVVPGPWRSTKNHVPYNLFKNKKIDPISFLYAKDNKCIFVITLSLEKKIKFFNSL